MKAKVLVQIGDGRPDHPARAAGWPSMAEMKAAGVDWRMNVYGGAGHSFTNPTSAPSAAPASPTTRPPTNAVLARR